MSDLILAQPSSAPPAQALPPRPRWGFWGTCAWGVAAVVVFYAAQFLAILGLLLWWRVYRGGEQFDFSGLESNAAVVATSTLASLPATLLVLWLAARLARISFVDYFALHPVGVRSVLLALACTLGYGALLDVVTWAMGRPMLSPFVVDLYRTARESGAFWVVLVAVVVAAPITEEFLFRGLLFRGWARSRLGVVGAVALTSFIWAVMHIQYDWLGVTEIGGLGLVFGWLRQRTGSLVTTLLMHGVYSLAAMIQVAVLAG
jgi:membrane protease YdiL (CAAX protease family)